MSDAGNLAALLLRFREENSSAYQRIVRTIRSIAAFFDDFDLQPDRANRVILNWREKESKGKVHRGGGRNYLPMKNDIQRLLRQDMAPDLSFTCPPIGRHHV